MTDPRTLPPLIAPERESVLGFLDYQRATMELKCAGLSAQRLAERTAPPSAMSLLGLVRHLADVERGWFRGLVGGDPESRPRYYGPEDPDGDFDNVTGAPEQLTEAFGYWHQEIEHARTLVAALDLDATFTRRRDGTVFSLRWVLLHLIEEYARHNGHADLLRERTDGNTGE